MNPATPSTKEERPSASPAIEPGAASLQATKATAVELERRLALYGWWLLAIVLAGYVVWEAFFLLRGPRLPMSHDELGFLYEALRLPGERRLSAYTHGVLLFELIAITESVWYVAARALGTVSSPEQYVTSVLSNLHIHLLGTRLIVGIGGGLLVVQVYRLGKHFGGPAVGALASLFVATNLTVLSLTATTKEDALLWLLLVTALEFGWRASLSLDRRLAVLTGVAIGAATATKYFGVFGFILCIIPFLAVRQSARRQALRIGVLMGAAGAATIVVLMPFIFTDTASLVASIRSLSDGAAEGGPPTRTIRHYLSPHLPNLAGWLVLALGAVEIGLRASREPRGPVLLLLVPLSLVLVLGTRMGFSQAYYAMPLAILFMIMASSLAVRLVRAQWLGSRSLLAPAGLVLTALFSSPYLAGSIKHGILIFAPDTRLAALDYIHANAAPGSCVTVTAGALDENFFGPPLLPEPEQMQTSDGVFGRARRTTVERAGGPYYDLRLQGREDYVAADAIGCEWLVIPRLAPGRLSAVEFGLSGPDATGWAREEVTAAPAGFVNVATFTGMPEWRSFLQPWYSAADYEELRRTSIRTMWREARYGRTQAIYRDLGGPAAAGIPTGAQRQ